MKRISIEEAIALTGYKKKYIAEMLGITPDYLPKYLRNAKDIPIEKAMVICRLTNKNLNEIDFGVETIFFN